MLFQRDELLHLGYCYIYLALSNVFAVIWPFWIIFLYQRNFSLGVISLGLALLSASSFLFEIPLGAVSDVLGRRFTVILGEMITVIIFLIMPFIHSPIALLAALFFWGAGIASKSGADEAWIVDYLKLKKRSDLIKEYYVKRESITNFSLAISSLLGAFLVLRYPLDFLWYLSGISLLASIFFALLQPEQFQGDGFRLKETYHASIGMLKKGISFTRKSNTLLLLIIAIAFLSIGVEIAFIGWQPFLIFTGIPLHYLGYLGAIGWLLASLVPFTTKYFLMNGRKEKNYLSYLNLFNAALHILFLFFVTPFYAGFVFIFRYLRFGFQEPVINPYFQKFVPSHIRGTVGSFKSLVIDVSYILGALIAGLFTAVIGLQYMMVLAGLIMLPAVYFLWRIKDAKEIQE